MSASTRFHSQQSPTSVSAAVCLLVIWTAAAVQICLWEDTFVHSVMLSTQSFLWSVKCAVSVRTAGSTGTQMKLHSSASCVMCCLLQAWRWCWPPISPGPFTTFSPYKSLLRVLQMIFKQTGDTDTHALVMNRSPPFYWRHFRWPPHVIFTDVLTVVSRCHHLHAIMWLVMISFCSYSRRKQRYVVYYH